MPTLVALLAALAVIFQATPATAITQSFIRGPHSATFREPLRVDVLFSAPVQGFSSSYVTVQPPITFQMSPIQQNESYSVALDSITVFEDINITVLEKAGQWTGTSLTIPIARESMSP